MASCSITGIVSPQSMTKKSYIVLFTVWCSEGYPYLHDFTALLPALFLIGLYLKKTDPFGFNTDNALPQ